MSLLFLNKETSLDSTNNQQLNFLQKFRLQAYNIELKNDRNNNNSKTKAKKMLQNLMLDFKKEKSLKFYENLMFNSLLTTQRLLIINLKKSYLHDCNQMTAVNKSLVSIKNEISNSQTEIEIKNKISGIKFVKKTLKLNLKNKLKICKLHAFKNERLFLFKDEAELYFFELNKPKANLILLVSNNKRLYVDQTILCLASARLRFELNLLKSINTKRIVFEMLEYNYQDIIEMLKFIYPQFSLTINRKFSPFFNSIYLQTTSITKKINFYFQI